MSWTTVIDLPMRRFDGGRTLDHTRFGNHADLLGGPTPFQGYVRLAGGNDQLEVPVGGDSLQRFAGLRIEARIRPTALPHRLNIVEGFMAFAFMVEANGHLSATIYDGQNWVAVDANQPVPLNQWSSVVFEYDGVCIGRLHQDGTVVGTRLDMPIGMRQPQQVITIGHWPRADHRYSFQGDVGHVRIDRRDHEDAWRDALAGMLCGCQMTPRQAAAVAEMTDILRDMDARRLAELADCLKARHERMRALVRKVRAGNARTIARYRGIGEAMRDAWCCGPGIGLAKKELLGGLLGIAGPPGSERREEYLSEVKELFDIGALCQMQGPEFDRLRELMRVLVPRLADGDRQFRDLLDAVEAE
ncbi:MAG: LamG domain-containing protein [Bauldia sp.]|uniref:LamG domain-containing protein n=1 Tax=Bauldia sp. TaxID=2575872 RepID=UPI001D1D6C04|nr:LamG domain-containing protein [Bauldia sp.]MCB1489826.1 LamG domain-containing protein [Bauldia sp.]MCB1495131.1 LamG domain-containing protein [Bauldia sp.]